MNRRELVAGVVSLGVLGGAATALWRGLPAADGVDSAAKPEVDESVDDGPLEIETIDARGSEGGTLTVPTDGITVVTSFSVTCTQCQRMMPPLSDAYERLEDDDGDAVTFVSIFPPTDESELREWWREHDGNWPVGFDPGRRFRTQYGVMGTDLLVIDANGEKRWQTDRVLESHRYARNVERVLEETEVNDEESG
ncbi:TlpA family protein disulfide reductase [Natronobacterium gregoryi]|uniref:AhpC/TSA family protein n=2 Tax=Natronobacterium gregoryi TaxID=44930 RepID=L0AF69_NATGS|nr:TlpA disulfide reductase family protein [Natronobacterium gregoryi]AFZ72074.1 AhpC/TSA family protein [Natronobacterium gregoryi SP2]ELY62753.1 alkyl hydroperoxide reductase/ thiol specific antioxidant/ Mal allergen [Natronobacterium gregoryi SP2]PLK20048.1 TlpA family protein disulfide reductase [Natronobacterium gregoryi SP2]SFJ44434.1 AhpC/TSA family protein [Natronobacterium gregoryi]